MKYKILILLSIFALASCGSSSRVTQQPDAYDYSVEETYKIGVGDQLQIGVWKNPELSVAVPVRPDGKISVPLAGDVVAAGRSTEELSKEVTETLGQFIRSPKVTVIVTSPQSAMFLRRVRITGAVNNPQSIMHGQGITVLDLVLQAGGLTPFAVPNDAKLYRKTASGLQSYPIRLNDILEKGRLETNYPLMPSDIVTVPERAF